MIIIIIIIQALLMPIIWNWQFLRKRRYLFTRRHGFSLKKTDFNQHRPEGLTMNSFSSEYFSLFLSVIIPSGSPYSSICHPVSGHCPIADCSYTKTYPYPIKIHVINFEVGIVFVCMLSPVRMRNWIKYAIFVLNWILPLMKFTSSTVNFGRREVVNPSA